MLNESISETIQEIERYKGVFDPDQEVYLDWVFRYVCRKMECFELNPAEHPERLNSEIQHHVNMTLNMVKEDYWKNSRPTIIYVPAAESIDDLLEHDLKQRHKVKT